MTRYEWPAVTDRRAADDPIARSRHLERFRVALAPAPEAVRAPAPDIAALAPPLPGGTDPVWVPIGPTTVLGGQAAGSPRVAGRVRDLAITDDGKRAYAAAAGGGVWYTDDFATTWRPVGGWATTTLVQPDQSAGTLSTGCLHVEFGTAGDGSDDLVVVGTGELTPYTPGTPGGKLGGVGMLFATGPAHRAPDQEFENPWTRVASNLEGEGIYRIARDPDQAGSYVVAASNGFYHHDGTNTEDEVWPRVVADPFTADEDESQVISDAIWMPRHDGEPTRIFAAWFGRGVWMSESGATGPYEEVDLPGEVTGRLGLAVAPSDLSTVYVLGAGPKLWRIRMTPDGPKARAVGHVPKNLFGKPGPTDQSDYDLTVAVHPTDSRRIVLGGAAAKAEGDYNAALVLCRVSDDTGAPLLDWSPANDVEDPENPAKPTGLSMDPTWIGLGVHADVHAARFVDNGSGQRELWIGCDGGVFRSRTTGQIQAGDRGSFTAINTGLGVLQPGYLASHPVNDTAMAAGTQDNGVIVRVGVGVWAMHSGGDGGGVAFHPDRPNSLAYQYTRAHWYGSGGWTNPVDRHGTPQVPVASEDAENAASSFYSGIAVTRPEDGPIRMAIGSNRVWLTDNWNPPAGTKHTWVTLPNGEDPRRDHHENTSVGVQYDGYDGQVIALRWMSRVRLLVLMNKAVLLYRYGADKWRVDPISDKGTKCDTTVDNDDISSPSDFLPPVEGAAFSDIAVHDAGRAARGSFYVSTSGAEKVPNMDTLWWFDGGLKWYRTGLREEGVPSPAYAVTVDQHATGDKKFVYVGTGVGVWRGEFVDGDPPDWLWTRLDMGLPEAAVQDLTIEHYGDVVLLRAAVQSRGVWELQLDGPAPPTTYLRSTIYDGRRGASSVAATNYPSNAFAAPANFIWYSSPDIAVRPVPGVVPPRPKFPITKTNLAIGTRTRALWQFQVALHHIDPAVRPDGKWTESFERRLAAFRGDHPVAGVPVPDGSLRVIDSDVWDQVVVPGNAFEPPWDGIEATEADLIELVRHSPGLFSEAVQPPGLLNVEVLVHHRGSRPILPADVRVALLRIPLSTGSSPPGWEAVRIEQDVIDAVTGALTPGNPLPTMPAPWSYADLGTAVRSPNFPVEARVPRPVTFRISGGAVLDQFLLVAVVSTPASPVAASPSTVSDLVRSDHHFAARVISVG